MGGEETVRVFANWIARLPRLFEFELMTPDLGGLKTEAELQERDCLQCKQAWTQIVLLHAALLLICHPEQWSLSPSKLLCVWRHVSMLDHVSVPKTHFKLQWSHRRYYQPVYRFYAPLWLLHLHKLDNEEQVCAWDTKLCMFETKVGDYCKIPTAGGRATLLLKSRQQTEIQTEQFNGVLSHV